MIAEVHRPRAQARLRASSQRVELAIVLAVACVATIPTMSRAPRATYDSISYVYLSRYRLPVVPVLYWALGENLRAIVVVQALIGAVCWSLLALEALRLTRRPYCYIAFAGVLWVSCTSYVTTWYAAILSDSLSISLLALLLASIASWLAKRGSLTRVVVVALLWAGTRDTNGYLLLIAGAVGLVVALVYRRRPAPIIGSLVAIAGGLVVAWWVTTGGLWLQPFEHVLTERILVDPARLRWFRGHGMPVTPQLQRLAGPWRASKETQLLHAPSLASFRTWMHQHGTRTYLEYALQHPGWALTGTFSPRDTFDQATLKFYTGSTGQSWLPAAVRNFLLSHRIGTTFVASGATAAIVAVKARALRVVRPELLAWGAVVVAGYAGLVIAWVGDSWEIGRHSVTPTVQIWVALVFIAAIASGAQAPGPNSTGASNAARRDARRRVTSTAGPRTATSSALTTARGMSKPSEVVRSKVMKWCRLVRTPAAGT